LAVRVYDDARRVWVVFHRAIVEVDQTRREEHEKKNERHHYVVLDCATLIRPKDKAFDRAPHAAHWHRWNLGLYGF
jgi:hypothetical protein